MEFLLNFTSTQADLLDAADATRTAPSGMRRFARIGVVGFGLMWVAASLRLFADHRQDQMLGAVIALVIGIALTWKFGIRPFGAARIVVKPTPEAQKLSLRFADAGVDIEVHGVARFHLSWSDIVQSSSWPKGVLFRNRNGTVNWVPNRAFHNATERKAFVDFARKMTSRRGAA
jgi:hypothetical protein